MSMASYEASKIAEALAMLGYGPGRVADAGLKVVAWARGSEADTDPDEGHLSEMEAFFKELGEEAAEEKASPNPLKSFPDSEHMAVEFLIDAMDPIGGNMPWVAEPIYDILDHYEKYLKEFKAPKRLFARLSRITHAINDIEMKASGRG